VQCSVVKNIDFSIYIDIEITEMLPILIFHRIDSSCAFSLSYLSVSELTHNLPLLTHFICSDECCWCYRA